MLDTNRLGFSRDFMRIYTDSAPQTHEEWKERDRSIRAHVKMLGYDDVEPVLPYAFFKTQDVDLLWHDTKKVYAGIYAEVSEWVESHT